MYLPIIKVHHKNEQYKSQPFLLSRDIKS